MTGGGPGSTDSVALQVCLISEKTALIPIQPLSCHRKKQSHSFWHCGQLLRRSPCLQKISPALLLAERQIVRGVKALQRLAVPDGRLLDYQDAKTGVERRTAEVRGRDRLEAMRQWVQASIAVLSGSSASHDSVKSTCQFGHTQT